MMTTWLLIDVPNLAWRAFHTTGKLANGVAFGFFKQLFHVQEILSSNRVAFCFDRKPLLRAKLYPEYKKRNPCSPEDEESFGRVRREIRKLRREHLPALGYRNVFSQPGFEADDVIASLCSNPCPCLDGPFPRKQHKEYPGGWETCDLCKGRRFIIVSSDEDLFQCLSPFVDQWSPSRKTLITHKSFVKEYGIEPIRWPGVKALAGCTSDNVKGIKGVGEKTAIKYLRRELAEKSKAYSDIRQQEEEVVRRNWPLIKLPFRGELGPFELREDKLTGNAWRAFCDKQGFASLANLTHGPFLYA